MIFTKVQCLQCSGGKVPECDPKGRGIICHRECSCRYIDCLKCCGTGTMECKICGVAVSDEDEAREWDDAEGNYTCRNCEETKKV